MALKDKIPKLPFPFPDLMKPSELLYWQLALAALILLCLILGGIVLFSGSRETQDAFKNGRRLLIHLDNGTIEGKAGNTDQPAAPAPAVTQANPPASDTSAAAAAPAASPAPTTTPDAAENAPAPATEGLAQLPDALSELDNTPITPSKFPMPAINAALSEKNALGDLPIIGSDGTKPWRYYAKPYDRKGNLPMIAIIVTGLGESKNITESAIKLPENFSLSFSPYSKDVAGWMKRARIAGHETFLDLPLEPSNYPASDPGPYGLLLAKSQEDNTARLQWLMARTQGYSGFVMPQNEAFSSNPAAFKALMQTLSERGLVLVVGHELAKNETKQALEAGTTANVTADTLIDEDLSATAIQARLTSLEQIAKTRGFAVGVAQAFPITMQQLNAWTAKLPDQGFVLVPVTFIVHLHFS